MPSANVHVNRGFPPVGGRVNYHQPNNIATDADISLFVLGYRSFGLALLG
jgi:hypothetical protein